MGRENLADELIWNFVEIWKMCSLGSGTLFLNVLLLDVALISRTWKIERGEVSGLKSKV